MPPCSALTLASRQWIIAIQHKGAPYHEFLYDLRLAKHNVTNSVMGASTLVLCPSDKEQGHETWVHEILRSKRILFKADSMSLLSENSVVICVITL